MSTTEPASPAASLANLILALLAPMFLWSTNGDIGLAYTAAAQTVNAYRVTNRLSLFTVAKIIAFDIATLSSLSLSMYEDVSMLLALRLRGNANSLDRSGERARRALELASQTGPAEAEEPVEAAIAQAEQLVREGKARIHTAKAPAVEPQPAPATEPAAIAALAPVPSSAAPVARAAAEQHGTARADAMTYIAEQSIAGLEDLTPRERWNEKERDEALTSTAGEPISGTASPAVPTMVAA